MISPVEIKAKVLEMVELYKIDVENDSRMRSRAIRSSRRGPQSGLTNSTRRDWKANTRDGINLARTLSLWGQKRHSPKTWDSNPTARDSVISASDIHLSKPFTKENRPPQTRRMHGALAHRQLDCLRDPVALSRLLPSKVLPTRHHTFSISVTAQSRSNRSRICQHTDKSHSLKRELYLERSYNWRSPLSSSRTAPKRLATPPGTKLSFSPFPSTLYLPATQHTARAQHDAESSATNQRKCWVSAQPQSAATSPAVMTGGALKARAFHTPHPGFARRGPPPNASQPRLVQNYPSHLFRPSSVGSRPSPQSAAPL
ncbi:hypothetical protein KEM48_000548 [Puccinia striiformis f. sp. tritici PST-130]|nr:hypothetical protein KEM48_000548 [Puccinia striiformis f. sp. tritici PST-130]